MLNLNFLNIKDRASRGRIACFFLATYMFKEKMILSFTNCIPVLLFILNSLLIYIIVSFCIFFGLKDVAYTSMCFTVEYYHFNIFMANKGTMRWCLLPPLGSLDFD
jgi:hypothetical protein